MWAAWRTVLYVLNVAMEQMEPEQRNLKKMPFGKY